VATWARPLEEYFGLVYASDVHDYGCTGRWCQDRTIDFIYPGSEPPGIVEHGVDWIISNPPFRLAEAFVERAWKIRGVEGVAMLVRSAFLEGIGRYERLFQSNPPSIVAQFAERVPMVKGRLDATISTATAYCWLVWMMGEQGSRMVWIPPCRRDLERPGDYPETAK
jgi:hypothetical protein